MDPSRTLMSAQINFVDEQLSLIHIPLEAYHIYIQPILQLLYPVPSSRAGITNGQSRAHKRPSDDDSDGHLAWTNAHSFLNVSITPIECSIVCSKGLADKYFAPIIAKAPKDSRASISPEEFVAVSVEGEGLEAGQRVLELTTPLAMAGISIFFFTTYFSDYLLVPHKARASVIKALEARGFAFSPSAHAHVDLTASHGRTTSSSSLSRGVESPKTPPPSSLSELQARTFALLSRRKVFPEVHRESKLLYLAGRSNHADLHELQIGITKCIVHQPHVFSLTMTGFEDPSILIDSSALPLFGPNHESILLGAKDDFVIPATLDLSALPFEATGIVCGLSGRLVGGSAVAGDPIAPVEMRYLSTARGAAVIVDEGDLDRAIELLTHGEGALGIENLHLG